MVTTIDREEPETQPIDVDGEVSVGGNGQGVADTQYDSADRLHSLLGHYARLLWDIQKLRIQVSNRISAMERDGLGAEWMAPHEESMKALDSQEKAVGRRLERLAKTHIMADWIIDCPGLGLGGFARIVGVTGSFERFPTVSKVWAYMGLHVTNGHAPKKEKGVKGNYAPQGRVVAHQIGDSIVKLHRGRNFDRYASKKAEYLARPRLGESGCPMGQVHKDKGGKTLQCVKVNGEGETSAHLHNAAMRYAVKMLIKDMWIEWQRRASDSVIPEVGLP